MPTVADNGKVSAAREIHAGRGQVRTTRYRPGCDRYPASPAASSPKPGLWMAAPNSSAVRQRATFTNWNSVPGLTA